MFTNQIKELEVQKNVINHVDNFNSFRFNAGAGAGKTYALIETLKYVTINKIIATRSSQKIACITYTNVAVNEIKKRLGNSEVVHVSTIHEMLWDIIKRAQPQLLICHKEKIINVIDDNKKELNHSEKAKFFINLDEPKKQEFIQYIFQTKDIFYHYKDHSAASFRKAYGDSTIEKPSHLDSFLKNVSNFKFVVSIFYKIQRLEECLARIESNKENRVYYDSKVNIDRLHYMKFSHDTLLEYGLKLVKTYPMLCRIIIDSYPYFFIDEYQDTNSHVVGFFKTLYDFSNQNNKKWMVGYFGDTAQCIYDDGVGENITKLHSGLYEIDKIFNRRSHQQIIDVANKIRADKIVQIPISSESNKGSVIFSHHQSKDKLEIAKEFLSHYKSYLAQTSKGRDNDDCKIHCLVLTNRLMAQFNDFENVYQAYQNSMIYHENLNTQVLSKQLEKLHPTILIIYNLTKLYQDILQNNVSYHCIFGTYGEGLSFSSANSILRELQNKEIVSLNDWIELITDRLEYSEAKGSLEKILINRINSDKEKTVSPHLFKSAIINSINVLMNSMSEDETVAEGKIQSILSLPIKSLMNWINFIDGTEIGDIIYHTYHGTKGEEYNNVAIILEHSFGNKDKLKFKNYFKFLQENKESRAHLLTDDIFREKHNNTKNLLYVACSRAIKNLRILYLDDISEIKEGIESIFGQSNLWLSDSDNITV